MQVFGTAYDLATQVDGRGLERLPASDEQAPCRRRLAVDGKDPLLRIATRALPRHPVGLVLATLPGDVLLVRERARVVVHLRLEQHCALAPDRLAQLRRYADRRERDRRVVGDYLDLSAERREGVLELI